AGDQPLATGTYARWYPPVRRQQIQRMIHDLEATGIRNILQIELAIRPDSDQRGMSASGMIVVNQPLILEQQMNNVLPWLHSMLAPNCQ
ncbi:23S rRNA (adenine(2030)-N(6))-methyltransferase RlmJ, partial [Salmonella enterica subsp. enterica serovar Infantis]